MTEAPIFLTPVDVVTGELDVSSLPEARALEFPKVAQSIFVGLFKATILTCKT